MYCIALILCSTAFSTRKEKINELRDFFQVLAGKWTPAGSEIGLTGVKAGQYRSKNNLNG